MHESTRTIKRKTGGDPGVSADTQWYWFSGIVAVLVIVALLFVFMKSEKRSMFRLGSGTESARQEQIDMLTAELVRKVGRLTDLPADVLPQIYLVTNQEAIVNESFFRDVINGDYLLVYSEKAVLYRPSTDMIIRQGPLVHTSAQGAQSTGGASIVGEGGTSNTSVDSGAVKSNYTVEVRNGTDIKGLAKSWKVPDSVVSIFTVMTTGNASRADYSGLTVYSTANVQSLTSLLPGAQMVTTLPAGEAPTNADVLIILGK